MRVINHTILFSILVFLLFPIVLFQADWILPNLILDLPILILVNLILLIYFIEKEIRNYRYRSVFLLVIAAISVFASFLRMIPLPIGMTMSFLLPIVSGVVYGASFGWIVGQLSMLIGGVFLGALGPWTPYQSFLMGVIGYYAGFLFHDRRGLISSYLIILYAAVVSMLYGYWMSISYWSISIQDLQVPEGLMERIGMYNAFYASTSLIWDITRAIGNIVLFGILYSSSRELLERAKQRLTYYR